MSRDPIPPERLRRVAAIQVQVLPEGWDVQRGGNGHPAIYDPETETVYIGGLGMHHSDVLEAADLWSNDEGSHLDQDLPLANLWPQGWADYHTAVWPFEAERAARDWAIANYPLWEGRDKTRGSEIAEGNWELS